MPAEQTVPAEQPAPDLVTGLWDSARASASVLQLGSLALCLFHEHALRHRLAYRCSKAWATSEERTALPGARVLVELREGNSTEQVACVADALVWATLGNGRVRVEAAAASPAAAAAVVAKLRAALPEPSFDGDDPRIAVSFFWHDRSRGAICRGQTLRALSWAEVRSNYAPRTAAALEHLVSAFRPRRSGETIIWHGPPGTGKTYALRALALAWRGWCDVQVVSDPDRLFGSDAGYLMEVLTWPTSARDDERYRLIVLEDAGELLTRDARSFVGQGLSRFLNVCDGLLGQSERVILLVTTNEPLRLLHPAVRRRGRCAAEVHFEPLGVEQANAWLAERCEARVVAPTPICDLYALAEGGDPVPREERLPIGFGRAVA